MLNVYAISCGNDIFKDICFDFNQKREHKKHSLSINFILN